jgi:hypothetical protein
LLINRREDQISINDPKQQITVNTNSTELARDMWQCWQGMEKLAAGLDKKSSAYLNMVNGKQSFQKAFASIV